MKKALSLLGLGFLVLSLFSTEGVSAERPTAYEKTDNFQAEWVVADHLPEPCPNNLWFVFRKSFELSDKIENATCRIACDSKYWLYVNGKQVVFEGQLKRGPTPHDTYFDVVDLAPFLQKGKNTVAVLMWYFGKDGFSHKNSGKPGLLFDASTNGPNGFSLLSDKTWKGLIYTNLGTSTAKGPYERQTADPQPNFRLPESNIRFNAAAELADWASIDFDDSNWPNVKTAGKVPTAPWNNLYERPIPLWKDFGLRPYENTAEFPKVSTGKPIRCRLPYNAQVTPYFKIEAPEEGLVVDMRTDNYQGGGEYNVRAEYVTKNGTQEYESLGWMNGHEMIYTFPEGVKVLSLQYRETGFDTEFAGSFECDDPFYNKLWEKSRRTLYVTMRDTYFDCPDRERAQWWGDEVNELGEAFYSLDAKSATLAKKGMYELMRWQRADGTIFSPVPAGNWDKELPMQMLASIGYYGFATWANYTEDYSVLLDLYPEISKYLDVWKFGNDGLILHRTGAWDWGDWGENIDLRVLANCWYSLALDTHAFTAMLPTGDSKLDDIRESEHEAIEAKSKRIADNFDKVFWTGTEYRDPQYKGQTDDRANAMAVLAGFAKKDKYPAIRKVLHEQKHASPYMEKYVLEALFVMGYDKDGLARMKERFTKMVDHEHTTLWEGWGIGAEGYGGGTINHAWSGGALTILSQYVAGVSPFSGNGFQVFNLSPNMGDLKWVKAKVPTKYGFISVDLNRTDTRLTMTFTVPEKTTCIVQLPFRYMKDIENVRISPQPSEWETYTDDGFHSATFSSGTWTIESDLK